MRVTVQRQSDQGAYDAAVVCSAVIGEQLNRSLIGVGDFLRKYENLAKIQNPLLVFISRSGRKKRNRHHTGGQAGGPAASTASTTTQPTTAPVPPAASNSTNTSSTSTSSSSSSSGSQATSSASTADGKAPEVEQKPNWMKRPKKSES